MSFVQNFIKFSVHVAYVPRLSPSLRTVQYVIYFRFFERRHIFT